MKRLIPAVILACGMFFPVAAKAESEVVFRQEGHACRLDYDRDLFERGELDGENYLRYAGPRDSYFKVTAMANDENLTPAQIREQYLKEFGRKDLVYERTRGGFLVLSGYRGNSIYYTKIVMSPDNGTVCVLHIYYPREMKRAFDKRITRMSHSFAAGE